MAIDGIVKKEDHNKLATATRATGTGAVAAGTGMQVAGKTVSVAGKGLAGAGRGVTRAGADLSGTGVGAIVGVPLAVAGSAMTATGRGMDIAGKGIDRSGRGVRQAGTQMRQAGGKMGKVSGISSFASKSPTPVGVALRARAIFKTQGGREEGAGKKLAGMGFVVMLVIALIKDALDLFLTITVVFSVLILALNVIYGFIMIAYLYMNGVRPSLPKTATLALGTIIESMPIASALLPTATLTLVTMRVLVRAGL